MSICALSKDTVKLITSAQVITSVYSVVKELVENALDAEAKNVEIKLDDNGASLIEVRDDGDGVPAAEVPRMTLPHYTSKIMDFGDLDTLTSYGFRGEALYSMCSVADVSIITRTAEDDTGTSYFMNHSGEIVKTELTHRSVGTTVRVSQLFKNFSVRRQLVTQPRKSKQIVKQIHGLLNAIAISKHEVRISYKVNGQLLFTKPSCNNTKEAISCVVGQKIAANLHWFRRKNEEVEFQFMIPNRQVEDINLLYGSDHRYIIVNNRPVQYKRFDKLMNEKINENFADTVSSKTKPVYFISIMVPPQNVDVNLEPNKLTVILHNEDDILKRVDKILTAFYTLRDRQLPHLTVKSKDSSDVGAENVDQTIQEDEVASRSPPSKKSKLEHYEHQNRPLISSDPLISNDDRIPCNQDEKENIGLDSTLNFNQNVKSISKNVKDFKINDKSIDADEPVLVENGSARQSINSFLKVFPPPHLSDSDSCDADYTKPMKIELETLPEKTTSESEPFEISPPLHVAEENNTLNQSIDKVHVVGDMEEELNDLPLVDLGEDFDISEFTSEENKFSIKTDPVPTNMPPGDVTSAPNDDDIVRKSSNFFELWSKGQVPGIEGATDVWPQSNLKTTASPKHDKNKNTSLANKPCYSGFSKFSNEIRPRLLQETPNMTLPELGKRLAERWKELSPEERGFYRDLALDDKKNAEAEKKKLKDSQTAEKESAKNKARLVKYLQSMKKTKNVGKYGYEHRTVVPWDVSVESITESFRAEPQSDDQLVVGSINDVLWAVKSFDKLFVVNCMEVFKALNCIELWQEEKDREKIASFLQTWLTEKKYDSSIMHPIYQFTVDC